MTYTPARQEVLENELAEQIRIRRQANNRVTQLVLALHKNGVSWRALGIQLGMSGQAAWEKYGLTEIQKAERSLQSNKSAVEEELPGLELTREERIQRRATEIKEHRARYPK